MVPGTVQLFSGVITESGDSYALPVITRWHKEALVFFDITAVSGTDPTLDIEIQAYDEVSKKWFKIAYFDQKTEIGKDIGPIPNCIGEKMAIAYVLGGTDSPSFTCTLSVGLKG